MSEKTSIYEKGQMNKNRRLSRTMIAGIIIAAILIISGGIAYIVYNQGRSEKQELLGNPVAASRSYIGKVEHMKPVQPVISDGKVTLNLADVDMNNIVGFELANNKGAIVPMMAYITSSGRLFVGSSLCECGGRKFSLAGKTLFCDKCRTTYDIENRMFISGASICGKYPPVNMKSTVENGVISFDHSLILNWRPRNEQEGT